MSAKLSLRDPSIIGEMRDAGLTGPHPRHPCGSVTEGKKSPEKAYAPHKLAGRIDFALTGCFLPREA